MKNLEQIHKKIQFLNKLLDQYPIDYKKLKQEFFYLSDDSINGIKDLSEYKIINSFNDTYLSLYDIIIDNMVSKSNENIFKDIDIIKNYISKLKFFVGKKFNNSNDDIEYINKITAFISEIKDKFINEIENIMKDEVFNNEIN